MSGTGFFVHPSIVLTAGHVVTFPNPAGGRIGAAEVRVECGRYEGVAASVAVPAGYYESSLEAPDLALLWMGRSCCALRETLLIDSLPIGKAADARVWGWDANGFGSRQVRARRPSSDIEYEAPDLPGYSGGPLLVPPAAADGAGQAVGVHDFHDDRGGRAVPLVFEDLVDGMKALGFRLG